MRIAALSLALVALALPLVAQEGERPAGWEVRVDRANADPAEIKFVVMECDFLRPFTDGLGPVSRRG